MVFNQIIRYLAFDLGVKLVKATIFLLLAGIGIKFGSKALRNIAKKKYSEEVVVELVGDLGKLFMWFWAILITLSILGFQGIATSLGTASGFVALGIAFALKNVISDTVAGAYLAQDPDFNKGDQVSLDNIQGKVTKVGLRKSRIELENGDLRIINNTDVEKKWTKIK